MRVGGFEFPDRCPAGCAYQDELSRFGQDAICGRCPVFVCGGPEPLVTAEEYRDDWAAEWARFFTEGVEPQLALLRPAP